MRVHSVVCDPPADARVGGLWVAAAYDALPPGGHLVAFGDHRLQCAVEDAGFEVRDSLRYGLRLEPIVLARRPLEGTVAANVLAHGTGALNIDGCRIGTTGGGTHCTNRDATGRCMGHFNGSSWDTTHGDNSAGGRWPANVMLDEEAAAHLDATVGDAGGGFGIRGAGGQTYGANRTFQGDMRQVGYGDRGGPSRFFFRGTRSEALAWLRTLVTPPGGVCWDPFA